MQPSGPVFGYEQAEKGRRHPQVPRESSVIGRWITRGRQPTGQDLRARLLSLSLPSTLLLHAPRACEAIAVLKSADRPGAQQRRRARASRHTTARREKVALAREQLTAASARVLSRESGRPLPDETTVCTAWRIRGSSPRVLGWRRELVGSMKAEGLRRLATWAAFFTAGGGRSSAAPAKNARRAETAGGRRRIKHKRLKLPKHLRPRCRQRPLPSQSCWAATAQAPIQSAQQST